jgi:hypothetical protein
MFFPERTKSRLCLQAKTKADAGEVVVATAEEVVRITVEEDNSRGSEEEVEAVVHQPAEVEAT